MRPASGSFTRLFRAVSQAELDDIMRFGFRPEPGGRSLETKLFATSVEDAVAFGRDLVQFDPKPYTIVEAMIPNLVIAGLDTQLIDGRTVVAVNPDRLDEFNAAAVTTPLPPIGFA